MRWGDRKGSDNVEDRRDEDDGGGFGFPFPSGQGGGGFPGGRIPIPMGSGGLGIFGVIIVVGLMLLFGIDPRVILQGDDGGGGGGGIALPRTDQPLPRSEAPSRERPVPGTPASGGSASTEDSQKKFVSLVLGSTEEVWTAIFRQSGKSYQDPKLVLFRGRIASQCGLGATQMGPFYCPLDGKVYIDLAFYDELQRRFHAPGEFAQAYVIAHEVGHHVQNLLGIMDKAMQAKARAGEIGANAMQVRIELQADCFAGIWAYYAQNKLQIVEDGDIAQGLNAAAAIGDDRIQKRMQGEVHPESFTHGSSEQRVRWFKRGFENGNFQSCDTYSANPL